MQITIDSANVKIENGKIIIDVDPNQKSWFDTTLIVTEYCIQGPCPNFKTVEQIKTEAYKEFAKRLENKIKTECNPYGKPTFDYDTSISILHYMDNLVKEMVSDTE